jgi:hypothetical protein
VTSYPDFHEYDKAGPTYGGVYREFSLERLLDVNNFLVVISFYILAKSGF